MESLSSIVKERLERQRHRRQQLTERRRSIFKVSEELHERLEHERRQKERDRLNVLEEKTASNWLAKRLLGNAEYFRKTGIWRPLTNEQR